ncbi:hypothetical protein NM688_g9232 [Phlebia brevispora]|uniref:Uncharacterized protein n=1 Tax=Phlebia brevispora TaxID=194682 RepID=A0ACC1RHZ9_9APHY|nr:hypothetical protein NM688_g9232 [Phlebia brevispora]
MMHKQEAQDIEQATTYVQTQPDNKTRRYDRQLRLWAASGQAALESSRVLVISASATSTSILKNLVLPGIGHFTILDPAKVTPADAGNNFFLNGHASIGKSRAEEAVPLLKELNESVDGAADTRSIEEVLETNEGREWVKGFSLVIAHNLNSQTLDTLSRLLLAGHYKPPADGCALLWLPGRFLYSISRTLHETAPSLRLLRPFPALKEWATSLDYAALDPTDHGQVPFVVILVKAAEQWKAEHNGSLPTSYAEKQAFKAYIYSLKVKLDEENFEEAEAQAFRLWSEKPVSSDVAALFDLPPLSNPGNADETIEGNVAFHALLKTLKLFVESPDGPGTLPLTSSLPDMKTDTQSYVKLQRMYKEQARIENELFKELLKKNFPDIAIEEAMVDAFVKNAHHIKLLRGKRFGALDEDKAALASALEISPRETATHLALSALAELLSRGTEPSGITDEALTKEVQSLVGQGVELPEQLADAVGELTRAPTADMPNIAAFLGGMVAQEAIKMITRQYVPIVGYCVVDLVDSWTGIIG